MSVRPLEIPAPRPVATGELVDLGAWPDYKRRHGLIVEWVVWPPHSPYPIMTVHLAADPNDSRV